jgi:hypothetical protein
VLQDSGHDPRGWIFSDAHDHVHTLVHLPTLKGLFVYFEQGCVTYRILHNGNRRLKVILMGESLSFLNLIPYWTKLRTNARHNTLGKPIALSSNRPNPPTVIIDHQSRYAKQSLLLCPVFGLSKLIPLVVVEASCVVVVP